MFPGRRQLRHGPGAPAARRPWRVACWARTTPRASARTSSPHGDPCACAPSQTTCTRSRARRRDARGRFRDAAALRPGRDSGGALVAHVTAPRHGHGVRGRRRARGPLRWRPATTWPASAPVTASWASTGIRAPGCPMRAPLVPGAATGRGDPPAGTAGRRGQLFRAAVRARGERDHRRAPRHRPVLDGRAPWKGLAQAKGATDVGAPATRTASRWWPSRFVSPSSMA
jgi:hypothetical protein